MPNATVDRNGIVIGKLQPIARAARVVYLEAWPDTEVKPNAFPVGH